MSLQDAEIVAIKSALDRKREAIAAAVASMDGFRLNSCNPFGGDPEDLSRMAREQAHALCLCMSAALASAQDHDDVIRPAHIGGAFEAIGTLISLSQFADGARP